MPKSVSGSVSSQDPRALRSKQALEGALLDLVAFRDLSQISISDITKWAGVSRSTFYEHYTDVHDLAASACTEVIDQMLSAMPLADPQLVDDFAPRDNPLAELFGHFVEHQALYRSLLGPDGSAKVINHLVMRVQVRTEDNLRMAAGTAAYPSAEPEGGGALEATLIAGALLGVVMDWLRSDRPRPPQELAAEIWPRLLAVATAAGFRPAITDSA